MFELFLLVGCACQNFFRYLSPRIPQEDLALKASRNNENIFVLGNGPSLREDLRKYRLPNKDYCFCALNKFVLAEEFRLLKPSLYVMPDRRFWDPEYSEKDRQIQKKIFEAFRGVDWEIKIFIPKKAERYYSENLGQGGGITLIPYSERALPISSIKLSALALHWKICTPIPINSLVVAIWFCLQEEFADITILGSDFDFFKGLNTNQHDNTVSFSVAHFYGTDDNLKKPEKTKDVNKPFHVRLSQVSQAFQQLHVLERYTKLTGQRIRNGASFSLIDAFVRTDGSK